MIGRYPSTLRHSSTVTDNTARVFDGGLDDGLDDVLESLCLRRPWGGSPPRLENRLSEDADCAEPSPAGRSPAPRPRHSPEPRPAPPCSALLHPTPPPPTWLEKCCGGGGGRPACTCLNQIPPTRPAHRSPPNKHEKRAVLSFRCHRRLPLAENTAPKPCRLDAASCQLETSLRPHVFARSFARREEGGERRGLPGEHAGCVMRLSTPGTRTPKKMFRSCLLDSNSL